MYEKKIGTLAKLAGVTSHTIKYYEKEGFVSSTRDSHSNYRFYDLTSCDYIHECMKYRNIGFSVKELHTLCKMANSETLHALLEERIHSLDQSIQNLHTKKSMTTYYFNEICELEQYLDQWFIVPFPEFYFLAQTERFEYTEHYQLDKNDINLVDYIPYAKTCTMLPSETFSGQSDLFFSGKIIESRFVPDDFLKRRPEFISIGGHGQKAFITYLKTDYKNYLTDGSLISMIKDKYFEFSNQLISNAYVLKIKTTYEPKETSYFKIYIPLR